MENSYCLTNSDRILCPACNSKNIRIIYKLNQIPIHSVILVDSRDSAFDFQTGDIILGFCDECGFIYNVAYDEKFQQYFSDRYESTQAYSNTFYNFHRNLAEDLIDRFDLHNKSIIEIGCGQGEFLSLLCELGGNAGLGFDPAYIEHHSDYKTDVELKFIKDYYSERYAYHEPDFIVCKMTLEHIPNPKEFVQMVRRSIGNRKDTIVFVQVPDVTRILREIAFWDIYYEHCSYFSPESLKSLFQRCGFEIIELRREYDNQYLMIEAKPDNSNVKSPINKNVDLESIKQDVDLFSRNFRDSLEGWRKKIKKMIGNDQRLVIWGAGSKGVAFLTTLGIEHEIKYAVDINPRKHDTFMVGSGQKIVSPQFLKSYQPDFILVMNPIYTDEIFEELQAMGIEPELISVG